MNEEYYERFRAAWLAAESCWGAWVKIAFPELSIPEQDFFAGLGVMIEFSEDGVFDEPVDFLVPTLRVVDEADLARKISKALDLGLIYSPAWSKGCLSGVYKLAMSPPESGRWRREQDEIRRRNTRLRLAGQSL
jgi:hypothetical protein